MRKTTIYLSDEDAEELRRLAANTGKSQAQLVREGVQRLLAGRSRAFYSLGLGVGTGEPVGRWDAEGLHRKVFGRD